MHLCMIVSDFYPDANRVLDLVIQSRGDPKFLAATAIDGVEGPRKRDLIVTLCNAGDGPMAEQLKLPRSRCNGAQMGHCLIGHRLKRLVEHLPVFR